MDSIVRYILTIYNVYSSVAVTTTLEFYAFRRLVSFYFCIQKIYTFIGCVYFPCTCFIFAKIVYIFDYISPVGYTAAMPFSYNGWGLVLKQSMTVCVAGHESVCPSVCLSEHIYIYICMMRRLGEIILASHPDSLPSFLSP